MSNTVNPGQLESVQGYSGSKYLNPSDHPAENEPWPDEIGYCGLCGRELLEEEEDFCVECEKEERG